MKEKLFTILLPIHRPPELLPFAVASVLSQTVEDFDLHIVCDGAPSETAEVARSLAAQDGRIQVHEFPKGKRNGEEHRYTVLEKANSRYVAQIADDDLWMNNHLQELGELLKTVDFGNLLHVYLNHDGEIRTYPYDLRDAAVQQRMLTEKFSFFGPTVSGYRLATYRRLPEKWSPAPEDIFSDQYMWRKFLLLENITVGTRFITTAFINSATLNRNKTLTERAVDMRHWWEVLQTEEGRQTISRATTEFLVKTGMKLQTCNSNIMKLRSKIADLEGQLEVYKRSQLVRLVEKVGGFKKS